jgi:hypothetical protein
MIEKRSADAWDTLAWFFSCWRCTNNLYRGAIWLKQQ